MRPDEERASALQGFSRCPPPRRRPARKPLGGARGAESPIFRCAGQLVRLQEVQIRAGVAKPTVRIASFRPPGDEDRAPLYRTFDERSRGRWAAVPPNARVEIIRRLPSGSARTAADYLLGERDATGQPSEGVEVLREDPRRWPEWRPRPTPLQDAAHVGDHNSAGTRIRHWPLQRRVFGPPRRAYWLDCGRGREYSFLRMGRLSA